MGATNRLLRYYIYINTEYWGLVIFHKIMHASNRTFPWFFGLISKIDGAGSIGPLVRWEKKEMDPSG